MSRPRTTVLSGAKATASASATAAGQAQGQGQPAPVDAPTLMRLRTRQLLLAAALGREQHLGRAAAELGISQPAATRMLRELEALLGTPLFDRHARGMTATLAGDALVRYARQMLNDFGATRRELAALAAGLHGVLRVGAVPSAVPSLLAPVLASFKARHARVAVAIKVATSDLMLAQLARGEVELMLGRLVEGQQADDFDALPVLDEPQVAVARLAHPLHEALAGAELDSNSKASGNAGETTRSAIQGATQGAAKSSPKHAAKPSATAANPGAATSAVLSLRELARWPWVVQPPGSP